MYKLDIPLDLKESAAIERRRNLERDRQNRIFNARVRTIGVSRNMFEPTIIVMFKCFSITITTAISFFSIFITSTTIPISINCYFFSKLIFMT